MEEISDTEKFYEENKIGKRNRQEWGRRFYFSSGSQERRFGGGDV